MTLVSGINDGLIAGLSNGLNPSAEEPQAPDPVDPAAQFALLKADDGTLLASIMGSAAPVHMVICDESDGGEDQIGTGDLKTAVNAPVFQVTAPTLGIDIVHMSGLGKALEASSSTPWDVGNVSMCRLSIGVIVGDAAGNEQLCGKADATIDGYEQKCPQTNAIQFSTFGTSGGTANSTSSFDHFIVGETRGDLAARLCRNDQNANELQIHTNLGDSSIVAALMESMASTNAFGVGNIRSNARNAKHALEVLWLGANAEKQNWTKTPREALDAILDFLGIGTFDDIIDP